MTALPVLNDLGLEILLIICDQLYNIAPESLSCLCLTSRTLNKLAMPFVYRNIKLRRDILTVSSDGFLKDAVKMIHSHVRHVVIECMLDWDLAAEFLTKCRCLKTLTWKNDVNLTLGSYFPERLKDVLEKSPNLGLNISCFNYRSDWIRAPSEIRSFPAANLVSFKVCASGRSGSVDALQEFLAASPRLQTLTFSFMIPFLPERGRLPPIKSLTLPDWNYTPENANRIWDFSLLQDLEIRWSQFGSFLKTVSPEDLGQLKRFRVDNSCWEWSYLDEDFSEKETFTGLLETLLEGRHDFQELDIRCQLKLFDMSLIASQGQSLLVLKLLDLAGFEMEGVFPNISLSDLRMIQQSCTRITKLDIGINVIGGETTSFLNIISGFRNLDDLTIYIQSKLSVDTVDNAVEDVDRQSAMDMKNALLPIKCGVPFSRLRINIGGWRENGPPTRRCGSNWDRRRSQGLNPERLFIVERNHEDTFLFREHRHAYRKPWPGSE